MCCSFLFVRVATDDCESTDLQCSEKAEQVEPSTKKRRFLRSSLGSDQQPSRSSHVLPTICIICRKKKHTKIYSHKRSYEPLVQCELVDGGQLLEAARLKKDDAILHHIEHKDCVAIEVKYHASCHREYTRFLSRAEPTGERLEPLYAQSFDVFCKGSIDGRIIRDKEIFRLTNLKKMFEKTVMDIDGKDSSNYKTWNLKNRLTKTYPQICFLQPSRKYESEFVYVDNLSTDKLIEDSILLHRSIIGSETDSTDIDDVTDSVPQKEHP